MKTCRVIVTAAAIVISMFSVCLAEETETYTPPKSVTFEAKKLTTGKQCIILNRTSPNFERELLALPPESCVIVVGEWIIKSDFLFKPVEIVSPKNDSWRVVWKNINSPMDLSNSNWKFKLNTKGFRQAVASISYHF